MADAVRTRFLRTISRFLVIASLAAILPVAVAQSAQAALPSLTITRWDVNTDTGVVDYDVTVDGGTCSAYRCWWALQGFFVSNGSERHAFDIASPRAVYGSSSSPVPYSEHFVGTATLAEATHLYLSYTEDGNWQVLDSRNVHVPYPDGSINVTAAKWDRNIDTGKVTYDLDLSIKGAGQINGACNGDCLWRIETAYLDGGTPRNVLDIEQDRLSGKNWTFSTRLSRTDRQIPEATHIRATVGPYYSYTSQETYSSGWIPVSAPYPDGFIGLDVNLWERDSSGRVNADLDVIIRGAGQSNGPCAGSCYWTLDAWLADGRVINLNNWPLPSGTWSADPKFTETGWQWPQTKAMRARLVPTYDPSRETYVSPWYSVSDLTLGDIDVGPLLGLLTAGQVTKLELCITVEERARILRIPDATPSLSPHHLTEACDAAASASAALKAIAAATGGAAVISAIIGFYLGDNPNADSVAKVPAPETDSAGSGVRLPPSCLTDEEKEALEQELEDGGWVQDHHAASNKNGRWTQAFKDLLAQHPYATDKSLNGDWNIVEDLLHRGTHPPAYHYWIYRNLEKALRESSTWDEFELKWNSWVKDVIRADPTLIRWEWWRC